MEDLAFSLTVVLAGTPTDITADVVRGSVEHGHGIDGTGPLDVVAGTGPCRFSLRNDAFGSRPVGAYSPGHANVRTGWDYGIDVQIAYYIGATPYARWRGKIAEIDPDPNPHGSRLVRVTAYDSQKDLVDAEVRTITPQVNQSDSTLIGAVLDAVPSSAQPPSRSIETGLDVIPFAFDKLGDKTKAATAIADVTRSTLGIYYTSGAGVGTYKTRQTRFTASSLATLTDADLVEFSGPTSREGSINVARVTFHPKHPTAGIVLWSDTGSAAQVIHPGEIVTTETYYRDPNQTSVKIGASSVTAPAAGVDYVGNSIADGSGIDLTSDLTVSIAEGGYTTYAAWSIENTGAQDVYLTTWQVRGTGIFDDGAQTVESRSAQAYGERSIDLDLKYLADRHVAYGIATLVREQRENPTQLPKRVSFVATRTTTLRALAMTAEIGDIITVGNTMTGASGVTCQIQKITFRHLPAAKTSSSYVNLRVTYDLAPITSLSPPSAPTGLGVATYSDTELTASWTNTDVTAETEISVDGVPWTIAGPGETSIRVTTLARATNYSLTAKHLKYAMLRSGATAGVTGRPTVIATGGSITTVSGTRLHTFMSSGTFTITAGGRVSYDLAGGGGGGGSSDAVSIAGGGGGAGGLVEAIDNIEPVGAYAVVIGAGGAGAIASTDATGDSGEATTYRAEDATGGGGGGSFRTGGGGATAGGDGGCGGGGSGEGGAGGVGSLGYNGGTGGAVGSGHRTGGGGGGMSSAGGNGVTGGSGSAVGGAGGTGPMVGGGGVCYGGQGGGPAGASGADAATYLSEGGAGNLNGDGGDGNPGVAYFFYPV